MSAIDELIKTSEDGGYGKTVEDWILLHDEAAAELAKLRTALDKARGVIQTYAIMFAHDHDANYTGLNKAAAAWLEEYGNQP